MRNLPALIVLLGPSLFAADGDGADFFEKRVRPLLVQKCLACHTAKGNPMGGLGLDSREGMLKGGHRGPAIVAGQPEDSLLIRAVRKTDEKLMMPPSGSLKDAEIATLAEWIQQGAPWGTQAVNAGAASAKYWSLVPPARQTPPTVRNKQWVRSPVDAFILSALEAKGIDPAPPADKRTLIRRATFDLTGLPPSPAEVRAFLDDHSPEAFANVIDRLLASPQYGERWGRHWLDVARYADSNGLDENLVYRTAYRYRDYVIAAFNKDKPYDQFVHEQLAGDLLPSGDLPTTFEHQTATGFLTLGAKMLAEDDPVKMEVDIVDEQLDTSARTFMGLTVGCARCHDHKFDPIPTADYYSMAGIFKSSKTMENFKVVAKWHEYTLAPPADVEKLKAHQARTEAKRDEITKITKQQDELLAAAARRKIAAYLLASTDLTRYRAIKLRPAGATAKAAIVRAAGSFDRGNVPRKLEKKKKNVPEESKGPFFAEYAIAVPRAGDYQIEMFELETGGGTADILINGELLQKGAPPVENREASPDAGGWSAIAILPLKAGTNVVRLEHRSRFAYFEKLQVIANPLPPGSVVPKSDVQVARQYGINPGFLDQLVDYQIRSQGAPHSVLFAWDAFGTEKPMSAWTSPVAALFADFRPKTREELAARYQELFLETIATKEAASPAHEALREFLFEKAGVFRPPTDSRQYFPAPLVAQLTALDAERKALEESTPEYPHAMGVTEGRIADMPIHIRGSHWTLGKESPRQFLRVIAGDNQTPIGPKESGRLQFAQWLTRPDHPLTGRVMANRIWRWHFGRGIVPSTDNFGRLGDKPTNQPLLDYLALEFVDRGWSVKQMHRLMMLSSTYQMSSAFNAKPAEADAENTLLWRMPRRRLEAEEIRDAIMSVAGGLDLTAGGTILKHRDRQYVSNTSKRGDIDYDRNRRAVYLPVVRSSMYDVFQAFDLPDPSTPNGDRQSTVIAPQALFMMNGSVVLAHSRSMAEKLLARADFDDAARIRDAYERALGRPAAPAEIDRALTFIGQIEKAIADRKMDDKHLFAWQSFCKALISSNEFVYLN